jgi:hypothetical protein
MRRVAPVVAGVLASVGVAVAVAMAGNGPANSAPGTLALQTGDFKPAVALGSGPIWGYWGKISGQATGIYKGEVAGSYRATCILLGQSTPSPPAALPTYAGRSRSADTTVEDRLACNIVLSFGENSSGDSLIAQGLVKKPDAGKSLFNVAYTERPLAITGGSGSHYDGKDGSATITGGGKIYITLD